jgi:DNA-directed RNA polymerase specialized sigma24 family protein
VRLPPNYTEDQVLDIINKVVNQLAPRFVFGSYDADDLRQEGVIWALELLDKGTYDPGRPLDNYIYTHVRNRMCNFKRDRYCRNDPPCRDCHAGHLCDDGQPCKTYSAWRQRNAAKANLQRPLDITNISDERERRTRVESSSSDDAAVNELLGKIDRELPVELRGTYLQMRAGVSIPKAKRLQVEAAVKEIIGWPSEDN